MTGLRLLLTVLTALVLVSRGPAIGDDQSTDNPVNKSRSFEFRYAATIKDLPDNANVRVWFPVAQSNAQQAVNVGKTSFPAKWQVAFDQKYGNKIGFFEVNSSTSNEIEFQLNYDVIRQQTKTGLRGEPLTRSQTKLYLGENRLVPILGRPLELLDQKRLPNNPLEAGRAIYDIVENHMSYDKSVPGYGQGDVLWACDAKTGNCTDFHSLFISLARSQKIPARFEIGFPLPPRSNLTDSKKSGRVVGYHCWAWFHTPENGWVPVDISEADKNPSMRDYYFGNLTSDRIAFSTGRDIQLIPPSKTASLNYFIYPHVEVDGNPWPTEKVELNFSFTDN